MIESIYELLLVSNVFSTNISCSGSKVHVHLMPSINVGSHVYFSVYLYYIVTCTSKCCLFESSSATANIRISISD